MSRPLYEIAREISADWTKPSPNAKTYIRGMYYLLGMDDWVADLNATTAVRFFLLYSKEWTGPNAERVKAELHDMRLANAPTNAYFFAQQRFSPSSQSISCCELCEAPVDVSQKYVQAYTHWNVCARMCMHCAFFLSRGIESGDGAVFMATSPATWFHIHGDAVAPPPLVKADWTEVPNRTKPYLIPMRLRFRLKRFGTKVLRKCVLVVGKWLRRSA